MLLLAEETMISRCEVDGGDLDVLALIAQLLAIACTIR